MIRTLYSAATGMYAQQLNIDNISNNLSNVNTNGFKKSQIQFQDLLYQTIDEAGVLTSASTSRPVELSIGAGVKPIATYKVFTQGNLLNTNNPLDIAIDGDGFFEIRRGDGQVFYTRDGSFRINELGQMVTSDGHFLEPDITFPADTESISISPDGIVMAKLYNEEIPVQVGQIQINRFINPAGLKSVGGNRYKQTVSSGEAMPNNPARDEMGQLTQGYLEISNVAIVEEMVNMIVAQRGYEVNSKSIRTAEAMLETATSLKR
ncbi:MAG TPA: flagellar basal-body rod protein FlgG [Candidatus Cloacimonadota bacterium]|jgi:flagellar basal-body rod protein FlgG|nr:flagellar basal-body rod protein FlgG [Candidatus Cloacimonadales bacterium]HPY96770.1 flagellar basal-body rod protein FlgG [Candidatus Cloacimonadota bacterium]HQB41365.1 flagellar basal-body rod protein FlgG [Candidatus Cloacimonadota bacterium]